jgi:spore coat polysaccharide biosynthesis protein SpsF
MNRTIAIIQARMSSTRLPGKVLKTSYGRSMLERMVERIRKSTLLEEVLVATTTDGSDDLIESACKRIGVKCFRGSLQDVLDRYYQAAIQWKAESVVRLTGDCPLIDPMLIDDVIRALTETRVDFACNRLPPPFKRTYPIGLDVEACTFSALENAWHNAKAKNEREHVMPYLYTEPGRFKVTQLNYSEDLGHLRWTLDTPQDLLLLRRIYRHFHGRNDFSWLDVLNLYREQPRIFDVNAAVQHKTYLDYEGQKKGEYHER